MSPTGPWHIFKTHVKEQLWKYNFAYCLTYYSLSYVSYIPTCMSLLKTTSSLRDDSYPTELFKKKIESNLWVYMSRYYIRSWTLKCNIIRALLDKYTEYYDSHPTQPAEVQNSFPQNMTNWFLKDEYEEDIGKTYTHRYETVPRVRRNSMLLECKIWSQKWLSYKAVETKGCIQCVEKHFMLWASGLALVKSPNSYCAKTRCKLYCKTFKKLN